MAMAAVVDHPISDDDSEDYEFDHDHTKSTSKEPTPEPASSIAPMVFHPPPGPTPPRDFTSSLRDKRASKFSIASNASYHSARDDDSVTSSQLVTPKHDFSIDAYDHNNHTNGTPTRSGTVRRDKSGEVSTTPVLADHVPQRLFTGASTPRETTPGSSGTVTNKSSMGPPPAPQQAQHQYQSQKQPQNAPADTTAFPPRPIPNSFSSSSSLSSHSSSYSDGGDAVAAMNAAVAAAIKDDGAGPVPDGSEGTARESMREFGSHSRNLSEQLGSFKISTSGDPSIAEENVGPHEKDVGPHEKSLPPLPHQQQGSVSSLVDGPTATFEEPVRRSVDAQRAALEATQRSNGDISLTESNVTSASASSLGRSGSASTNATSLGAHGIFGTPTIDDAQFETSSKPSLVGSLKAAGAVPELRSNNSSRDTFDSTASSSAASTDITELAERFFNETYTQVARDEYAAWLGDDAQFNKQVCQEYMTLFAWQGVSILASLRLLCTKLYMKGESQVLSRIMEQFSLAWVQANPTNGFISVSPVYTTAYALILLNTDLYAADHSLSKPITKAQFVKNTSETIVMATEQKKLISLLPNMEFKENPELRDSTDTLLLVSKSFESFTASQWLATLQSVLRVFYNSISKSPLQIRAVDRVAKITPISPLDTLAHTNAQSRSSSVSSSLFSKFRLNKNKHAADYNMSRIDNSLPLPSDPFGRRNSIQSNFSIETGMSSGSFTMPRQAVGFAGILWNSMAREETSSMFSREEEDDEDDFMHDISRLENALAAEDELQLYGAPWAKEGLLLYRPYVDPHSGKRSRKTKWKSLFVVVQKGQLKLFDLSAKKSSLSTGGFGGGGSVGGGNWMENAHQVDAWSLCHTIAQELPNPKRTKSYQALWSLTLPQYGLLVFQSGTSEIAKEFVYTCNYWSARLSKEPMNEAVSNMEYGWSFLEGTSGPANGDHLQIKEWKPRGHSLVVSDFDENRQLTNIKDYLASVETQLSHHNGLLPRMLSSYTQGSQNYSRAHANWERKSQYLLQQTVRFRVYVDALETGIEDRKEPGRRKYDVIEEEE
ncbi:PH and SEC7 domain-containing protein [Yarrowia sp. B02]|nr:PH and SEC7 domain-containing protein [Yarrowia sp. B02]